MDEMLKDCLSIRLLFSQPWFLRACPRPYSGNQAWQRQLELQPVQFLGVELDSYLYQSRQKLGEYIHTSATNISYIPNATHGVNIVARSLKLDPGDEIVTSNQEYGACNYTWQFVCEKTGAEYKTQSITLPAESAEQIVDQFWQAVTPRTKVIFISHIASPTSLTLPIRLITQRARQAGILTVIDGAHAPGQITLDLDSLQADFYLGNCHKWMLSPKGAGFIYARPEVQSLIEPLVVSWGYQTRCSPTNDSSFVDYLQWSGTKDPAAALSVPAAIEFMNENEWNKVRFTCHNMLRDAMERIYEITGLPPLYPLESDFYQQMATIPIPQVSDLVELKNRLYSDYKIEIPCLDWEKHHYLRLSIQGYNSGDDIDKLVKAIKVLLPTMKVI
jgi:isopenicillin-N epimerase